MTTLYKIKLKKGDTVMVRSGKHKGKTGTITAVHPRENKVTVEGINIIKKHIKPTRTNPTGGIVEITKPIWVSKVGLVHPTDKKRMTRIGMEVKKDGSKVRVARQAGNKEIK